MFKRAVYFSFLLSFSVYPTLSLAQQNIVPAPSAEDFAVADDRSFSISDDGKKVAFLSGDEKNSKLVLIDVEAMEEIPINLGDKTKPRSVFWADSDHLLINVSFAYNADLGSKDNYYKYEINRIISYSLSTKKTAIIMPNSDLEQNTNLSIEYIDKKNKKMIVLGLTSDIKTRDFVVFGFDDKLKWSLGAYYADFDSGLGKDIVDGNVNTNDFIFDKTGKPRLRIDIDVKSKKTTIYKLIDKKAIKFLEWEDTTKLPFEIEGFIDDNNILISESENNNSRLKTLNIENGKKTDYVIGEKKNILNIIKDPYTKEPIGIAFDDINNSFEWLDKKLEKAQTLLDKTFSGKSVSIEDWDESREKLLVSVSSNNQKTRTYLFNTKNNSAGDLSIFPESIENYEFPIKTLENFKASDGLEIPVFITRPKNPNHKKRPAILLPHGGPRARDDSDFDYMSQFLASRGYVIIQPQYRGSTGNGLDFEKAGHGEWAGKMQTDTVEALDYAISKGDIDKNRVCIVGASYGGYSALVGIAQDAAKFKCAISYGGISDLAAMQYSEEDRGGSDSLSVAYWREHMGVTRYDSAKIHAISPLYMVDKIKSPVLLMHGTDDTVVMPEQSQKMYAALKKAGKDVKYIELKDEDHWLSREKTRAQFLTEMENFLAPILKPQE